MAWEDDVMMMMRRRIDEEEEEDEWDDEDRSWLTTIDDSRWGLATGFHHDQYNAKGLDFEAEFRTTKPPVHPQGWDEEFATVEWGVRVTNWTGMQHVQRSMRFFVVSLSKDSSKLAFFDN